MTDNPDFTTPLPSTPSSAPSALHSLLFNGPANTHLDEVADALIELAHNHWFALDAKDRMFDEAAGVLLRKAKPAAVH
ncbi:hypothetical protein [Sinorhizobium sp. Sb3]|uniref:hypothetical protein n=1 Tax=Sinorhizobium/Ensifer group TaxID=227292 RepID=UPI000A94AF1B|nr:hypothetical protein [Sinorhizobium sp. Sb3]